MSSKGFMGALLIGGIALLAGQTAQNVAKQTGLVNTALGLAVAGGAAYAAIHVLK